MKRSKLIEVFLRHPLSRRLNPAFSDLANEQQDAVLNSFAAWQADQYASTRGRLSAQLDNLDGLVATLRAGVEPD